MTTALETIENFQRVSELFLKGYKAPDISRALGISQAEARGLIKEYEAYIGNRAMEDPDFLDRVQVNTLKMLDEVDMQSKEAWELFESAKNLGVIKEATSALKLAGDLTSQKAKLLQLMGARTDSGMVSKMQRLEQVNEIVTKVIRETISGCERCKRIAQQQLAEAFDLMDRKMEPMNNEIIDDNIVDAEVVF